jgi:hypothetical protein
MSLIKFICPDTGKLVASAINRRAEVTRPQEAVICPCCERFHVLDTATSAIVRSADITTINLLNFYSWDRAVHPTSENAQAAAFL